MNLRFEALSLNLGGRQVLRNISGAFARGEVTVILGANGAGKTMLLSCLAGLRTPDSGELLLGERALGQWSARARARHIGLLPQQGMIHWDISVRALVALGRLPHHERWGRRRWGRGKLWGSAAAQTVQAGQVGQAVQTGQAADQAAIATAMQQSDCAHLAERRVQRLSGGERARVLLARLLAGEHDWLLADEPLANLDLAHQLDVIDCLGLAAKAGAGVVLVLHDLTHAARLADRLVIMKQGRILAAGPCRATLTPGILAEAFDIAVHITCDSDGLPVIVPMSRARLGA